MDFVKKHKVLAAVLGVTALISAFLIFLDLDRHSKVISANSEIEELKSKIISTYQKSPAPVIPNVQDIAADAKEVAEKTRQLQKMFGKPYRNLIKKFAETIKITEDDLSAKFRDIYNKSKTGDRDEVFEALMKELGNEKEQGGDKPIRTEQDVEAAFQNFKVALQPHTVEIINQQSGRDIFLCALGLPRTMLTSRCKVMIDSMQETMIEKRMIPGVNDIDSVRKITFDYKLNVPPPDMVPFIIRSFQIFEDIFWRMSKSGISSVDSFEFEKFSDMQTHIVSDHFLRLTYKVKLTGDINSIRRFVNFLQSAYEDDRIYIIREISLTRKATGEVAKARELTAPASTESKPGVKITKSATGAPEEPVDPSTLPDYGKILVGADKLVFAEIEFDYYIYVGDELKPKQQR